MQLGLCQIAQQRECENYFFFSALDYHANIKIVAKETFSDIEFFEQVSAASYCTENNIGPNIRLKCRTKNCPHVDDAEMWTVIGLSK
jgi:hypothetical protein